MTIGGRKATAWMQGRIMRSKAITGFGVMLIFVLVFAVVFFLNFKTVVVSGPSMEPAFHNGDRVLAGKAYWLIGAVRRKDVIVIRNDDGKGYIIKRVAYLAGDTVDYYNVPDSYSLKNGDYVVPQGSVYVLGDNRAVSEDSRKFGHVTEDRILGKVVILPPSWAARIGLVFGLVVLMLVVSYSVSSIIESKRKSVPAA